MARSLRLSFPNAMYHIYARGNRKERIFFEDRDRIVFLEKLKNALKKYSIICHAYCLMNNHYHLFLTTPLPNISQGLHYLNSSYANWIKAKHALVGVVFQGRFKSILVDGPNYALTLSAYIHLNPVRVGIVKTPREFQWSSFGFYLGTRPIGPMSLNTSYILNMIDPDARKAATKYERFVLERLNMESPFKSLYKSCVLGDKDYIEAIKKRIKARGRDREIPVTTQPADYENRPMPNEREQILAVVSEVLGVPGDPGCRKKGRKTARDVALFALRSYTPLTLKEIGNYFAMDYVAVHQAVARLTTRLTEEPWLREKIDAIEIRLGGVKS